MTYCLKDHGDILEKKYYKFIETYFPSYEHVWKIFIGNTGNDIKASIPKYSAERDEKRQAFSEHTYTVLQSIILMYRLVESKSFDFTSIPDFEQKMLLQNNILLFFTHIGRIRDNTTAAANCLVKKDIKALEQRLDEFYHKRHIPVHGRILPIVYKQNGEIEMPILSKDDEDPTGWNHKVNNWPDILSMPIQSISSTVSEIFWQLLPLLNDVFGGFKNIILQELDSNGLSLKFEYLNFKSEKTPASNNVVTDIYGIKHLGQSDGSGSFEGKNGSGGYGGHSNR